MSQNNTTNCNVDLERPHISQNSLVLVAIGSILGVISVLTFVANVSFIAVVCLYRRKYKIRERNKSQILMMSLATSDAIIGGFMMPQVVHIILNNGEWNYRIESCLAFLFMDKLLSAVSLYHVAFMAFDRYLAASKPIIYHRLKTTTMIYFAVTAWSVPLITSIGILSMGFLHFNVQERLVCMDMANTCTNYLTGFRVLVEQVFQLWIPVVMLYTLYLLIVRQIYWLDQQFLKKFRVLDFTKADRSNNAPSAKAELADEIGVEEVRVSCNPEVLGEKPKTDAEFESIDDDEVAPKNVCKEKETRRSDESYNSEVSFPTLPRRKQSSVKAYSTIGCIVLAFTIAWVPFGIYYFIVFSMNIEMQPMVYISFSILNYANSLFNPICYCFTMSVREAYRDALRCSRQRQFIFVTSGVYEVSQG
uniref:G-protein coupled receptors family 1 profile domain-containing protein n=1 Tax=Biomphalaria glabrata TaxID=6526 RepID=A0A2C9KBF3_BIOGL